MCVWGGGRDRGRARVEAGGSYEFKGVSESRIQRQPTLLPLSHLPWLSAAFWMCFRHLGQALKAQHNYLPAVLRPSCTYR